VSDIAKSTAVVNAAHAAYAKHPASHVARIAYATALAHLGNAIWKTGSAPAEERYKAAIALYHRAFVLDPTNAAAKLGHESMVREATASGVKTTSSR
jgi:hypothetical protein